MGPVVKILRSTKFRLPSSLEGPRTVKVGFPAGESDAGNIQKAVWNEFGTKGSGKGFKTARGGGFGGPIPERPFLRNAMRNNEHGYKTIMGQQASKLLRSETSMSAIMAKLGVRAQVDIQSEIETLASPPNSPVTIAIKGSNNPLMDSGAMRAAVGWKVNE